MALRAGSVGLCSEAGVAPCLWLRRSPLAGGEAVGGGVLPLPMGEAGASCVASVRQATNSRLRTGTDKGNPTV